MPGRSTTMLLAALAALCLAMPGTASAQSAGDEQYADPFGELPAEEERSGGGAGGGSGGGEDGGPSPGGDPGRDWGTGEDAPPLQDPGSGELSTPVETDAAPAAPAPAGGEDDTLPRTGVEAGLLALTGVALLAAGSVVLLALVRWGVHAATARAWPISAVHQAPRPPGFAPLHRRRRRPFIAAEPAARATAQAGVGTSGSSVGANGPRPRT